MSCRLYFKHKFEFHFIAIGSPYVFAILKLRKVGGSPLVRKYLATRPTPFQQLFLSAISDLPLQAWKRQQVGNMEVIGGG
jgi:hypothetical protein